MNTGTIRQTVKINATPRQVYDALMNSRKHARFSGEKAKIANKVGGRFSCYDGYITGVSVDLQPGKLIVQAWKSLGWPKDFYSLVTFKLSKAGKSGTKLVFTHSGVPRG